MTKAVFTTKVNPTYDDLPEVRYHFPRTYLNQARDAVGDWIVYYEPRRQDENPDGRAGRQAYFAIARVTGIRADTRREGHFYADIADYLPFDRPVPFREAAGDFYESALRRPDGRTNRGAFGRAVRKIPDEEYDAILRAGFAALLAPRLHHAAEAPGALAEDQAELERPAVAQLVRRPLRDAAFAQIVSRAYDFTCALTGLRIVNGGGRPEIEAAHIQPVAAGHAGPDSIRNGLALSRTAHWMFDRGLLSLSDDLRILAAKRLLSDAARRLLRPDGRALPPRDPLDRPHPTFLRYHREHIFKG